MAQLETPISTGVILSDFSPEEPALSEVDLARALPIADAAAISASRQMLRKLSMTPP
ncbi:MAG: hypothetical protein ACRD20_10475 [Terriglobales bacterium]